MRALDAEFELLGATRVPARVWDAGMRPGWRLPGWRRSGAARERGSADPRCRGPRFFRGATDKPRTPTPGVRATQLRALLISIGAVLATAFKKIENRGNELKDLLQRQVITEIANSKRTHFRAEKAAIGAERSGISRIVTARRPLAKAVLRDPG